MHDRSCCRGIVPLVDRVVDKLALGIPNEEVRLHDTDARVELLIEFDKRVGLDLSEKLEVLVVSCHWKRNVGESTTDGIGNAYLGSLIAEDDLDHFPISVALDRPILGTTRLESIWMNNDVQPAIRGTRPGISYLNQL
jgi:hypothetical protein